MKVADLAAELEVPTSMILDQCQRFGIDATWAGAELAGADVVVLRAELAATEPIDLTAADPVDVDAAAGATPAPAGAEAPSAAPPGAAGDATGQPAAAAVPPTAVPPTAVGSMPELIDEVTPEPEAPPAGPHSRGPGFPMAGTPAGGVYPEGTRRVPPRPAPAKRRLERGARNAIAGVVVAALALGASNLPDAPALVLLLWLIGAISLCVAVVEGFRGRRQVQVHPERVKGIWPATICIVLAIGGLVGLTASVVGASSGDSAAAAPLGVGDLHSVQVARWGYQRVDRYKDNGWKQPAREQGSCWEAQDYDHDERDEQRVEIPKHADLTTCTRPHTLEVARVFAYNRDADAPYPDVSGFVAAAGKQCGKIADRLTAKGVSVQLQIEYPTEVGWGDGDHDVACVLITPERRTPLAP